MTQSEWKELYSATYAAYDYAALKDEYARSTLGDVLDHLILLEKQNLLQTKWYVTKSDSKLLIIIKSGDLSGLIHFKKQKVW